LGAADKGARTGRGAEKRLEVSARNPDFRQLLQRAESRADNSKTYGQLIRGHPPVFKGFWREKEEGFWD